MRLIIFLYISFLFLSCKSQEGLVSVSENDKFKITTVQLKGAVYSTPVVTDEDIVVLGTHKKMIYFLSSQGDIVNKYKTDLWVHATPTIVYDSLISVGSYDGNMYFFNGRGELQKKIHPGGRIFTSCAQLDTLWMVFATGMQGLWFYNIVTDSLFLSKINRLTHGTPVVLGNNEICIGSNDKRLYFFDRLGNVMTTFKTNGWIMHSKALPQSDSTVVVGSYDNNLYSVSSSGKLLWDFETDGKIHASPQQFVNGNIICGSFDKNIYVVNNQGQKVAQIETGKRVVSSAAIVKGEYAAIGSYDEYLYIIDSNGAIQYSIYMGGKVFSSPQVLSDGTIFCATTNGKAVFVKILDL